jgi:hypothetical protein
VHTELEAYHQQFENITQEAGELVSGLSEEEFSWRPGPGQWSMQECFSHLTMVGQVELLLVEAAIDDARARGVTGAGPFRHSALERFIIRETEPPARRRMSSPKRFVPSHGHPVTAVMPTFYHVQSGFAIQIARADGLDLRRVKVPTPISRFLKFSLGATFAQTASHERRHVAQARRVKEKIPKGVQLPATH